MEKKESKVCVTYEVLDEKAETIKTVKKETNNVDGLIRLMKQEVKNQVKEENDGYKVVIESIEIIEGENEKVLAKMTKGNLEIFEK